MLQTVFIVLSNFSVRAHADNSAPPLISYIHVLSEFKYGEVTEAGCRVINIGCESEHPGNVIMLEHLAIGFGDAALERRSLGAAAWAVNDARAYPLRIRGFPLLPTCAGDLVRSRAAGINTALPS